ncbi:hypothetical protein CFELI_06690 [Corynebacterium felinum]|uniref:Uncharacterized protein n=1 Tax=Corynebacterium felinum TaxID=131318 RepID=A0ABU2BC88_9CORY|nr:hypothetical protein [Corynebacterium felinum]MDR7355604.1 hypothetical protein [Corynebacterium felinum]WJY94954.1 hypothetical protein CFELI_06690 [Corynebacterium felinum]
MFEDFHAYAPNLDKHDMEACSSVVAAQMGVRSADYCDAAISTKCGRLTTIRGVMFWAKMCFAAGLLKYCKNCGSRVVTSDFLP